MPTSINAFWSKARQDFEEINASSNKMITTKCDLLAFIDALKERISVPIDILRESEKIRADLQFEKLSFLETNEIREYKDFLNGDYIYDWMNISFMILFRIDIELYKCYTVCEGCDEICRFDSAFAEVCDYHRSESNFAASNIADNSSIYYGKERETLLPVQYEAVLNLILKK